LNRVCISLFWRKNAEKISKNTPARYFELRLDAAIRNSISKTMEEQLKQTISVIQNTGKKVIITLRDKKEGGLYEGKPEEKVEVLKKIIQIKPDYLDVENDFEYKNELLTAAKKNNVKIIVSKHFEKRVDHTSALKLITRLLAEEIDIVKLVIPVKSIHENIELLEMNLNWKDRTVIFGAGKKGLLSRFLAPLYGAPFTYAYHPEYGPTAPSQPSINEIVNVWKRIGVL